MGLLDILNSIQSGGGVRSARAARADAGRPKPGHVADRQGAAGAARGLRRQEHAHGRHDAGAAARRQCRRPAIRAAGPPATLAAAGWAICSAACWGGGRPGGAPGGGGLRGLLGGLLGGGAAGTALNGGLGGLIDQLQRNGQGDVARSWVGTGPNKAISQDDLATALGADTLDMLAGQTGMDREEMLAGLSQQLPRFVDQLTPDGRLPTDEEAARLV